VTDQGRRLKLCNGVFSADWQGRADTYMLVGKVDLAISDYLQALKIARANRDALRGLAEAYTKKGQREKAKTIREQLNALDYGRF
jgi:tetratricopeptide (TPR) repeat protein